MQVTERRTDRQQVRSDSPGGTVGSMRPAARVPPLPRLLVVAAFVVVAGAGTWVSPAAAQDAAVEVRRDGFTPAEITVQVGDTVTWTWVADGHSVTHDPDEGTRAFDSHPDCTGFVRRLECGARGDEFSHTFETAGTYAYESRMDGNVRGTVVVEPAPTETATAEPSSPDDEAPSEPSEPSEEDSGSRDPAGTDDADTDGGRSSPPRRTTSGRAPAQQFSSSGDDTGGAAPTPEVATADPTETETETTPAPAPSFDAFPEPTDPATATADVAGDVAVGGDGDGTDTGRVVWGLLGGATVLGTAGVFSRTVLFGDAWSGRG